VVAVNHICEKGRGGVEENKICPIWSILNIQMCISTQKQTIKYSAVKKINLTQLLSKDKRKKKQEDLSHSKVN
jgi:hypothetical protein